MVRVCPTALNDGTTECWETTVKGIPDIKAIEEECALFRARQQAFVLEQAKREKIREIDAYDTSTAVNEFFYGNIGFWLPRETRVAVCSTAKIMKKSGHQTMTLWLRDFNVTLAPEEILQMLTVLEMYALECYNTTARHKANIKTLTTIEDVEAYDYKAGYPEKIKL